MAFIRMARPMRRTGSSFIQFRERIPRDVRDRVRGLVLAIPVANTSVRLRVSAKAEAIKVSLRTRDPGEAKARHAAVHAYLANIYRSLRCAAPRSLTMKQCAALAGEFYRAWGGEGAFEGSRRALHGLIEQHIADDDVAAEDVSAGLAERGVGALASSLAERHVGRAASRARTQEDTQADQRIMDGQLETLLRRFLLGKGIGEIDPPSMSTLLAEVPRAVSLAFGDQVRRARSDWSPSPHAQRFPAIDVLKSNDAGEAAGGLTAAELFERWHTHPGQKTVSASTLAAYSPVFNRLGAFLKKRHGKEPAARDLTPADMRAYIDMRSNDDGVKPKTINGVDMGAINSVLNWAVKQELLTTNPAAGIKLTSRKDAATATRKSLSDAEAAAILMRAFHYTGGERESPKLAAAKRWVPWLMAYTGTRVGEPGQLRKSDVVKFDGAWAIRVTPEAGTTKTNSTWHIPLHPHLIEQGFIDFVEAAPAGHLFLTPRPDLYRAHAPLTQTKDARGILGPLRSLTNRLAEFARDAMPPSDGPTPAPNHGWRHRFKAVARRNGIDKEVRDAFADHASGDAAGEYGKDELFSAMVAALDKIPRYEIG